MQSVLIDVKTHELRGKLHLAENYASRPLVFYAGCFTCTMDYLILRRLGDHWASKDISWFSFDFSGLGRSGGRFEETTLESMVRDYRVAHATVSNLVKRPEVLVGHSLGGFLSAVEKTSLGADRLITLAAPADLKGLRRRLNEIDYDENGKGTLVVGPGRFRVKRAFLDSVERALERDVRPRGQKGHLVIHSPEDRVVDYDQGLRLFEEAGEPKAFFEATGMDHLFRDIEKNGTLLKTLDRWILER